ASTHSKWPPSRETTLLGRKAEQRDARSAAEPHAVNRKRAPLDRTPRSRGSGRAARRAHRGEAGARPASKRPSTGRREAEVSVEGRVARSAAKPHAVNRKRAPLDRTPRSRGSDRGARRAQRGEAAKAPGKRAPLDWTARSRGFGRGARGAQRGEAAR